jgi:PKD repeat protein
MSVFPSLQALFHRPNPRRGRRARPRVKLVLDQLEDRLVPSLVAAYSFDEGSGTLLHDLSGNGNNGTIANATWANGKYGGSLNFTGKTNSMVTVPSAASLNLTSGMTLEAWVYATKLSSPDNGWCSAFSKGNVGSNNDVSYALYAATGTATPPGVQVLVSGNDQGPNGTSKVPMSTWTFLAATYDGTTLSYYVNGKLVGSQTLKGSITTTGSALTIGGDWSGEMFTGLIDNLRIYNTALSQSAIQADMSTPLAAAAPTVKSWTPATNATAVTPLTTVTATFSGPVSSTTVNTSTVQLFGPNNTVIAATLTYNSTTYVATLTPSSPLLFSTVYTCVIKGGSSGVKDSSGNALAANVTWSFTTEADPGAPVANAGSALTSNEGSSLKFGGSETGGLPGLTYTWNFGDGTTGSGSLTPSHTYNDDGTYSATLTVTDALGRSSSSSVQVTVSNVASTVNAGGPYAGAPGRAISFSGTATVPDPTDTLTYLWNFGDGTTSTAQSPTHAYAATGSYTVTLTVTDSEGASASASATVSVTTAPVASAGPNVTGNEGSAVTFSGSVSGGAAPFTYSWAFGDGTSGSGSLTPSHTYADDGTYTATLTVTDGAGRTSSSTTTVTINNVPPTVNTGGPYTGNPGVAISFSGSATVPDPTDTFTYLWNFGDGTTSTAQSPNHTYATAGIYTVGLTVTDSEGASTFANTTATVSVQTVPPVTSPTITTPYLTIPNFGAKPNIVSIKSGNWSDPSVWSLTRVPTAGDVVDINPGFTVTYDVFSTAQLNTLEIQPTATLTFRTDVNTQVVVGNFLVLQGGSLIVGTAANPIAAKVVCNINLGNLPLNSTSDPQQFGGGLIVLGAVTMHGAVKTPYVTLAQEVHAGDTVLHLAAPANGWRPGDDPVLPDTRQLKPGSTYGASYQPQWERVTVQSVSADGLTVYLAAPVKYSHLGARDASGVLDYLPQVINDSRNIMVQSQNMTGVRGYTLFTGRANVDIEYAGFCELGRTTNNPTGSGNVADRYAMTLLDLIGPTSPQANGYQFTLIGNEVDNDGDGNPNNPSNIQWGLALNNSFYGLIQGNTVWAVAGAGMGVEDGASSYNRFDGNFVGNVTGTAARHDQQRQGDGFWFGNPNNYVTNNIATDINGGGGDLYSYGFDIDATYVGTVTVPALQGADPSAAGQGTSINMNDTPILQFAGNQLYGASAAGLTLWWIGTYGDTFYADARVSVVKDFVAWDFTSKGVYGYPTNNVTIDGLVVRGDESQLNTPYIYVTGLIFDDYMTHALVVRNCDIQGMATGIYAPFMVGRVTTMDTTVIENCFLDNTDNIDISPPRSVNGSSGLSPQTLDINNVQFANPSGGYQPWFTNISMDYITSDALGTSNMSVPQYVYVTNYNDIQGDNFQVFYSQTPSPTGKPPANATTVTGIEGMVALT